MDRLAKQLFAISDEIEQIQKTASQREAGLMDIFNIFDNKLTKQSSNQVIKCLQTLKSNIDKTFIDWLIGDMSYIKSVLKPLKTTKAEGGDAGAFGNSNPLKNFYKTFADWFMNAYKNLAPGLKNYFKTMSAQQCAQIMKSKDGTLGEIAKHMIEMKDGLQKKIAGLIEDTKKMGVGLDISNEDDAKKLLTLFNPKAFDEAANNVTVEKPAQTPAQTPAD